MHFRKSCPTSSASTPSKTVSISRSVPTPVRYTSPVMAELPLALTYDDVLLVPRRSRISSRRNVDTCSCFSRRIEVATPIVSANMDTVTEASMAIAMARLGGIGVIHRFMSLETEAQQVRKVKRSESSYIENPYALQPHNTVGDALKLMD